MLLAGCSHRALARVSDQGPRTPDSRERNLVIYPPSLTRDLEVHLGGLHHEYRWANTAVSADHFIADHTRSSVLFDIPAGRDRPVLDSLSKTYSGFLP